MSELLKSLREMTRAAEEKARAERKAREEKEAKEREEKERAFVQYLEFDLPRCMRTAAAHGGKSYITKPTDRPTAERIKNHFLLQGFVVHIRDGESEDGYPQCVVEIFWLCL